MKLNFVSFINEAKNQGIQGYVNNGMINLYRYSHRYAESGPEKVVFDPKFFGKNPYSKRESISSKTPKLFFYVDLVDKERYFSNYKQIYRATVLAKSVYDLTEDSNRYLVQKTIDEALEEIKKDGYKGVFYNNGMYIVAWFYPIECHRVDESEALKDFGYTDIASAKAKEVEDRKEREEEERLAWLKKDQERRRQNYATT